MPADASEDVLRDACRRFNLALTERLPNATGSVFLARVLDSAGRELLLKRANGVRGYGEARVAAAWAGDPAVPGNVVELDERTFVREWIDGTPMGEPGPELPRQLASVGRAMRRLHALPPPSGLPDVRLRFTPEGVLGEWQAALPPAMLERASALATLLRDHEPDPPVLLHGDLVPGNVLIRRDGSTAIIDPVGFTGMPARDLAQLAVATTGRDRRSNLEDVLRGYGSTPPLVLEAFAWLAFMFLEKHIELERAHPGTRSAIVGELQPLCESLFGG